jgi:RNA polymerase sigma factor (sigma-70 family)
MAVFFARRESREAAEDSTWTAVGPSSRLSRLSVLSALPRSTTLVSVVKSVRQGTADGQAEDSVRDAAELLAGIAHRRDRSAFATLFRFYAPRLKSHLLVRGADSGTAEEIVQDVMLTVWRKAEQFDATRGSASTWIYTLARNAFIDRVRREHRPEVDLTDPILDATDPGADRLVLDAESQRELAAAVEALPAEQQHVVRRSYFCGQSLSQISAADGLPLGTVKTRARLALLHLRALVTHRRET